ncbi:MAG: tyrosinase family protein [Acidobacteriota bacterium]|nr:tyrosinase family protein [Acidobacteriota bacterium]
MDAKEKARTSSLVVVATILLFTLSARPDAQQASAANGQVSAPQVRMRWQDFISGPDGTKRLTSLKAAVQKMKSLDNSPQNSADYRRSWQYWANIHGYYGAPSPDGTVEAQIQYLKANGMGNYVSYYQGITDQSPPDSTAQAVWATCQHSEDTQALNFFGWHRMYLYYFERVLRWAAADDTLRLPYWDYTDPTQVALPAEFQSTVSALYDSRRDPGMNTSASTLNPASTNVNALLRETDYFSYEKKVEHGIHGYVHCTVGPTCPVAHMGDVPLAGNDPVFYFHHSNIDRLWACWQNLHPTPAGDWQDQQFSFVDETGTMQTQPVKNFLDPTSLGYVYDNAGSCARGAAPLVASKALAGQAGPPSGERKTSVLATTKSILISRPQTSVDINVPKSKLHGLFAQPEGAGATELVLRDVTAQSHPGVLFDVYLAKKGDPTVRKLVGTISWFGAFRHHGSKGPEKKTLQFDVTDQLRGLGEAATSSGLTVTIEATQGRVPADPSKAQAMQAAAAEAFRPQAKLQIGAIELQQVTVPPVPENR